MRRATDAPAAVFPNKTTALRTLISLMLLPPLSAFAQSADTNASTARVHTVIRAQRLETALQDLAQKTDLQIVCQTETVGDIRTPGISGELTRDEALKKLLETTNLTYHYIDDKTVTIERVAKEKTSSIAPTAGPLRLAQAEAQSVPSYKSATEGSAANADSGSADLQLEQITVTGSRIKRDGSGEPTPTLVTTAEELQATSPDNLTQGLIKLPIFNNSGGASGSGGRSLGSGGVNQTGSFLNLRNFGTIRTLILLDGRRVPPTNFDGNVDVDTLPQALIQRVDVVTGGASAVYGSDAVTGVVNYVLDRKFTGLKGIVQGGISEEGDNEKYRANVAFGTSLLDGRGHFIASAEYSQSDGVGRKESRDWFKNQLLTGAGTATNPFHIVDNGLNTNAAFGGKITAVGAGAGGGNPAALLNMVFNPDGTLRPFDAGGASGTTGTSVGGDGAYHIDTSLAAELESEQVFGRFQYELTDNVTAFVQANYSRRDAIHTQVGGINRQAGSINAITIFKDNAFLLPEVNALIPTGGSISVSQFGLYGRPTFGLTTSATNASVGLEGALIGDLRWDATYTYGEGRTKSDQQRNSNNNHFYAAVDAVRDASGNIVCRVSTMANADLYPGCVPINVMGVGNTSDASLAYTLNSTGWDATNTMNDISANVTGPLFDNWAGPVSIAVGAEYREQKLEQTTTDDPNTPLVTAGLRGIPNGALSYAGVLVAGTEGSNDVWEVNSELVFPLLKNLPAVYNLELNGAFRYTNYSNSGGVETYKIGGDYQPIPDLRFRAAKSRDIRAPTLNDLYGGSSVRVLGFFDPLTNRASSATNIIRGNAALTPEISHTETAGFVYTPSWAPGLQLSVDYYRIKLEDAIGPVDIATAINECTLSGGVSSLCDNFVRPISNTDTSNANYPTLAYTQPVNLARIVTRGVDFEVGYSTELGDIWEKLGGVAGLRVIAAYQPVLEGQSTPAAAFINAAGQLATQNGISGVSDKRVTVLGSYENGRFTFNFQTNWSANQEWSAVKTQFYADPEVGSYTSTDVRFGYELQAASLPLDIFLAINNVFDQDPRIFPSTANPGQVTPVVGGDDVIGRFFTLGARVRL